MMTALASGGGMPAMPGMPGLPGMGKRAKGRQTAKKGKAKRGSGNPAKRAQQVAAAAERRSEVVPGQVPAAFGGPRLPTEPDNDGDFQLPDQLRSLLPPSR